ncbi:MAG: MipA/OmpV family protein [Pseudoalteromonas sp.]|uniref:MipA/OmpV family protein n=1 Tax=unclassified Pseudoalteromonas TaxID=194690 RepID=UPI003F9D6AC2
MKYFLACLLNLTALISVSAFANTGEDERGEIRKRIEPKGLLYGFGLGINQELYKGYDRRVIPLPIIGYRGERFSALGPFISYDLIQKEGFKLAIQAAPRFQGFDSNDSDIFEGMDERKFSFDGGFGLTYQKSNWKVNLSSMFDILNRSDGYEIKSSIGRAFKQGPIFIEPTIGVSYLDANHVNYYYGVGAHEVGDFRPAYEADSAINTKIGLSIGTPIFLGGFTRLNLDYTMHGSSISDSPLVDSDTSFSLSLIYSRFF